MSKTETSVNHLSVDVAKRISHSYDFDDLEIHLDDHHDFEDAEPVLSAVDEEEEE